MVVVHCIYPCCIVYPLLYCVCVHLHVGAFPYTPDSSSIPLTNTQPRPQDAPRVLSAREFVQWYNGHPDNATLPIDLSSITSVAICGLGNVALDCARILLRNPEDLAPTDIAHHALQQLRRSRVRHVHLLGRRGPAQAACTAKELRELLGLPGVRVCVRMSDMQLSEGEREELKGARARTRVYELFAKAATSDQASGSGDQASGGDDQAAKLLSMHFFRSPVQVQVGPDGGAAAVVAEITHVVPDQARGGVKAQGTGEMVHIPAQMVLKSIGYRSLPLPGVPFDARRGVIPNTYVWVLGWGSRWRGGGVG